jgi:hypothetical protein
MIISFALPVNIAVKYLIKILKSNWPTRATPKDNITNTVYTQAYVIR